MKTSTNERSLFFMWTYKCLKYFFFAIFGFAIACMIPISFNISLFSIPVFWFLVNLLWRLGMIIIFLLGIAIVFESWR